ncbi:MAG: ATP synthase F0 subunit B [Myxococcales bacterium]|nr:ATP synthase F0 subunit B [Myxococcales bacterium]
MRILSQLLLATTVALSVFFSVGTAFATVAAEAEPGTASYEHEHGGDGHTHDSHGDTHAVHGAPVVNWTDWGYRDMDVHGNKLTSDGEPMAPPLLLALLNFAIFAGLLYWKAGPALSKYLANRHESIKSALEEAAKLQEEAKEKLAEYSTRIKDADAEVNALIEQIRRDAETEREQIVVDAEKQAERMRQDAEDRIETEFLAAKRELEREVIAKATEATEKLLSQKASPADHNTLFTNFISDLKSGKAAEGKGGAA